MKRTVLGNRWPNKKKDMNQSQVIINICMYALHNDVTRIKSSKQNKMEITLDLPEFILFYFKPVPFLSFATLYLLCYHLIKTQVYRMSDTIDDISAFESLDLYQVLQIDVTKTPKADVKPDEIKKAYRKLALKVHPDKAQSDDQREEFHKKFQELVFAYSILKDEIKKKRYDTTGSLDDIPTGEDGEGDNLRDFLNNLFKKGGLDITEEMIREDKEKYRENEEYDDLIAAYKKHKGDFALVYEEILHTEDDNDKDFVRLAGIVQDAIDDGDVKRYKAFGNWEAVRDELFGADEDKEEESKAKPKKGKKTRKPKKKSEAEEAEELAIELGLRDKKHGKGDNSLQALIAQRQQNRMSDLVNSIENKYGKKKSKRDHSQIEQTLEGPTEEEFQKIQKKLGANKEASSKKKKSK